MLSTLKYIRVLQGIVCSSQGNTLKHKGETDEVESTPLQQNMSECRVGFIFSPSCLQIIYLPSAQDVSNIVLLSVSFVI